MSQSTDSKQNFENESVKVSVERKPLCLVSFDVEVAPLAAQAAYQRAFKNVQKEVSLPGFRRGKAPEAVIREKFSSAVQKEFPMVLVQTAVNEAVRLSGLIPARNAHPTNLKVHSATIEGGKISFDIEVLPRLPDIDLQALKFPVVAAGAVTEEMKQEAREAFAFQFAEFEPIEDRPAQEGDYIEFTLEFLSDPPRVAADHKKVKVVSPQIPQWLLSKVVGARAGDVVEGEEEVNKTPYRMTIHKLLKGILPPFDEELAKKLGAPSLEALFEHIDRLLVKEKEESAFNANAEALRNFISSHYAVDVPYSLIDLNARTLFPDLKDIFAHEMLVKELSNRIGYQMMFSKLQDSLVRDHHLDVSDADIAQELTRTIQKVQRGEEEMFDWSNEAALKKKMRDKALYRKTHEFLIEQARSN